MKSFRWIAFSLCSLYSVTYAQNAVQYKLIKDDPRDVTNFSMALDLANFNAPFFGEFAGMSFDAGIWGTGMYKQKAGFDYTFRSGWFSFGRLAAGKEYNRRTQIELGGYLTLNSRNVSSTAPITLASRVVAKTDKGQTNEITYVKVPVTKWIHSGVRAGFLVYRTVAGAGRDENGNNINGRPDYANLNSSGFYIGWYRNAIKNAAISTDQYAIKSRQDNWRWYADVLILPIHTISQPGASSNINDLYSKNPVGFRIGLQTLPIMKRKEAKKSGVDKKFAMLSWQMEVGVRPYEGLYASATWAISILNLKSKALGYTTPASEVRTSE
jgi:hypothetical protein